MDLLRTRVSRSSGYAAQIRRRRVDRSPGNGRLCQAEIDDAWHGPAVDFDNQDVCRLEILMNYRLLMGMLNPVAGLDVMSLMRSQRARDLLGRQREPCSAGCGPCVPTEGGNARVGVTRGRRWRPARRAPSRRHFPTARAAHPMVWRSLRPWLRRMPLRCSTAFQPIGCNVPAGSAESLERLAHL